MKVLKKLNREKLIIWKRSLYCGGVINKSIILYLLTFIFDFGSVMFHKLENSSSDFLKVGKCVKIAR